MSGAVKQAEEVGAGDDTSLFLFIFRFYVMSFILLLLIFISLLLYLFIYFSMKKKNFMNVPCSGFYRRPFSQGF